MDYLLQTPAQLATHLRSLRKAKSLTQTQLGRLVGLDQSRIAKIERNPRLISVGQLLKILNALGTQVVLQPLQPAAAKAKPPRPQSTPDW
jgi:HTH-type transcriptional regulator/antitoxin HipB